MLTVLIQHFSSLQQQPSKTFPFCFRFRWFSFSWITFSCNMQQALLLLCSNFCYCVDIYLNFFRLISNFWVSLVSLVSRGNLLSSRPLVDHYYIHWKYHASCISDAVFFLHFFLFFWQNCSVFFEDQSLSGYLSTCAMFAEWSGERLGTFFQPNLLPWYLFQRVLAIFIIMVVS